MSLSRVRVIAATGFTLCVLASTRTSALSIGIFADPSASSCNISLYPSGTFQTKLYLFVLPGQLPELSAVEFRVDGLPALSIPPALEFPDAIRIGSTISEGLFIAFSTCRSAGASGLVPIGTVTLITLDPVGEHTLSVRASRRVSNPAFDCPLVQLCDPPAYTSVCVAGGQAFLNSSTDCTVAVKALTWSQIKQLYH